MLCRAATGGYKGNQNSTGSVRESELPIVPLVSQGQHNRGGGKGQCLHHVSEERKEKGIAEMLKTPEKIRELQRKLYRKAKQDGAKLRKPLEEDDWKAVFGKTERTV